MFYMFDYFMKGFKFKDTVHVFDFIGRVGMSSDGPFPNFSQASYCLYLTVRLNEASVSIGECFAFGFKLRNNLKDVDRILPTPKTSNRRGYYRILQFIRLSRSTLEVFGHFPHQKVFFRNITNAYFGNWTWRSRNSSFICLFNPNVAFSEVNKMKNHKGQ